MAVKVIILRQVPPDVANDLTPLLIELRQRALEQPGYISGETLLRVDHPEEQLVISTWDSLEHWEAWRNNPARAEIQNKVDEVIGSETLFQVYYQS